MDARPVVEETLRAELAALDARAKALRLQRVAVSQQIASHSLRLTQLVGRRHEKIDMRNSRANSFAFEPRARSSSAGLGRRSPRPRSSSPGAVPCGAARSSSPEARVPTACAARAVHRATVAAARAARAPPADFGFARRSRSAWSRSPSRSTSPTGRCAPGHESPRFAERPASVYCREAMRAQREESGPLRQVTHPRLSADPRNERPLPSEVRACMPRKSEPLKAPRLVAAPDTRVSARRASPGARVPARTPGVVTTLGPTKPARPGSGRRDLVELRSATAEAFLTDRWWSEDAKTTSSSGTTRATSVRVLGYPGSSQPEEFFIGSHADLPSSAGSEFFIGTPPTSPQERHSTLTTPSDQMRYQPNRVTPEDKGSMSSSDRSPYSCVSPYGLSHVLA